MRRYGVVLVLYRWSKYDLFLSLDFGIRYNVHWIKLPIFSNILFMSFFFLCAYAFGSRQRVMLHKTSFESSWA